LSSVNLFSGRNQEESFQPQKKIDVFLSTSSITALDTAEILCDPVEVVHKLYQLERLFI